MSLNTCNNCGVEVPNSATFCYGCGDPLEKPSSITTPTKDEFILEDALKLDCNACRSVAIMIATKIPRFNGIIRLIGTFLLVPSFLGIGFSVLMIVAYVFFLGAGSGSRDPAQDAGFVIGTGIGIIFFIAVGAVSFIGGVVGWLLLLDRNVWKCQRCGSIIERA